MPGLSWYWVYRYKEDRTCAETNNRSGYYDGQMTEKCYDEIKQRYGILESELVGGGRNMMEVVLDTVVRE